MDRMLCKDYQRHDVIVEYKKPQDSLVIVLSGRMAKYSKKKAFIIEKDTKIDGYIEALEDIGKDGMTEFQAWQATYLAAKKTMVISLTKRDLIDVLSNSRTIETSNRQ